MKTIRASAALAATLATMPAWAADTVTRPDHSGFLVWAFLGMCALIVVAQLAPATLLLVGMVKGVAESRRARKEVPAV